MKVTSTALEQAVEGLPIVVGVDPSWTSTGVAVFKEGKLVATNVIKRPKDNNEVKNLIACLFANIIKLYEGPIVLAIESQFIPMGFASNSIAKVIEAKGIIEGVFLALRAQDGPIIEVHPLQAKQAVGIVKQLKRAESKKAVKAAVLKLYPFPDLIPNQDIADAVAIGHCALRKIMSEDIITKFTNKL